VTKNRTVAVILPTYNEGKSIFDTLIEIEKSLISDDNYIFKIFVAEDGSSDNTRSEVQRFAVQSKIQTILAAESPRLGYSRGVQRAILENTESILVFLDSDGQYDPDEIKILVRDLEEKTIVVGVRSPRNDSKLRIIYSNLFGLVYKIIFRIYLSDPSSPFIAANKKDIDFLSDSEIKLDFGFWWEFQARIASKKLKIKEIPVKHRKRIDGKTQVYVLNKLLKIVATHLIGLVKLRKELNKKLI
jgi:glycosyltransferase involved in cell wall biosynthesis